MVNKSETSRDSIVYQYFNLDKELSKHENLIIIDLDNLRKIKDIIVKLYD